MTDRPIPPYWYPLLEAQLRILNGERADRDSSRVTAAVAGGVAIIVAALSLAGIGPHWALAGGMAAFALVFLAFAHAAQKRVRAAEATLIRIYEQEAP